MELIGDIAVAFFISLFSVSMAWASYVLADAALPPDQKGKWTRLKVGFVVAGALTPGLAVVQAVRGSNSQHELLLAVEKKIAINPPVAALPLAKALEVGVTADHSVRTIRPARQSPVPPHTEVAGPIIAPLAPIVQTTNAPCSGNSLVGNVDNSHCGQPDPYAAVITYDPYGLKRISRQSGTHVTLDQSLQPIFNQLEELRRANKSGELLRLVDATRKTDPDWFTLDFYAGMTHGVVCDLEKAVEELERFMTNTKNAQEYDQMRDIASQVLKPDARLQARIYCATK